VSKLELLKNFQHPRITVKNTSSKIADKYQIHIGEASVITFAKENNALAIIDDKKAREAAEKEGVSFVGTVTLIRLGVEKGTIKRSEISSLIEQITTIGRLYVSEDLRKWIMR
jgi:predicted nucleic acid-binding protein